MQKKYIKIQNELNQILIDNEKEKKKEKWKVEQINQDEKKCQYLLWFTYVGETEAKNVEIELINSEWKLTDDFYEVKTLCELGDFKRGARKFLHLMGAAQLERTVRLHLSWKELDEKAHETFDLFLN